MLDTNIYINMSRKALFLIFVFFTILVCVIGNILKKVETTEASAHASNTYKILVDVEESKMYIFENRVCVKTYTCAGGKYSTPSPVGTWKIISKGKWGEGFGGSWLRT